MKVAIIINGDIKDIDFHKIILNKYDYIICADGASNHAFKMDIVPNIIIGDLDSIDECVKNYYENKKIKFEKFPSKKDKTDTQLCIDYALSLNPSEIVLLGAIGTRMDHSLSSIYMLFNLLKKGIKSSIINENNEIYIIDDYIEILGKKGDLISIIPCFGDCKGVTLENLEYPLCDFDIDFASSIGISNVMKGEKCKINLKEGYLLVIKSKDN